MVSKTQGNFRSPLGVMLILHGLCAAATVVVFVTGLLDLKWRFSTASWLLAVGVAARWANSGAGFLTLFVTVLVPLGLLLLAALVFGLICGKRGLPGHLQGRAVFFVPPLSAVYFIAGCLLVICLGDQGTETGWAAVRDLLGSLTGLTLVLLYAALSTSAVGIGWAIALAITRIQRSRGMWRMTDKVENVL